MSDINFICALLDIDGNELIRNDDDYSFCIMHEDIVFHSVFSYNKVSYEVVVKLSKDFDEYIFYLVVDHSIIYYCFNTDYNDLVYYIYKDRIKEHFDNALFFI